MSTPRLEAVERVHIPAERTAWEQPRRRPAYAAMPSNRRPKHRLVESVLPGHDPETCEVDMVLDESGNLTAIVIRNLASGEELTRLSTADLALIGTHSIGGGLLVERRG